MGFNFSCCSEGHLSIFYRKSYTYFESICYVWCFSTGVETGQGNSLIQASDPMLFCNYRPVSVLPVFSKIFEKIVYNQLLSFINKHKLSYSYQFGFRINHTPELHVALLCLADKISDALENGEYVIELFLDFSKAFDTVNHDILLAKLEFLCIRGVCLQCFSSYLSKREQYVVYTYYLQVNGSRVVFHRDLFLVRCYFCYISMIWPMHQIC